MVQTQPAGRMRVGPVRRDGGSEDVKEVFQACTEMCTKVLRRDRRREGSGAGLWAQVPAGLIVDRTPGPPFPAGTVFSL